MTDNHGGLQQAAYAFNNTQTRLLNETCAGEEVGGAFAVGRCIETEKKRITKSLYLSAVILIMTMTKLVALALSLLAEMVEAMKKVASLDVELTVEERNLLSVAYKNVIGARRASWRIISSIEQKEENKGAEEKLEMIKNYRGQVEKELRDICSDILNVLEKHLIPCASTGESRVFYYKMKGDYHRYLAEFATGTDRKEAAENSLVAYKAASDIAMTDLPPTHPIRLGLALNFSVSDRNGVALHRRMCCEV